MQFFLSLKGKHKLPIYGCICIRNDFQQFVVVNSFFSMLQKPFAYFVDAEENANKVRTPLFFSPYIHFT